MTAVPDFTFEKLSHFESVCTPCRPWPHADEPVTKVVEEDDGIRPDFTFEKLSKHKPCFKKGGTTTPGNASQVGGLWSCGAV